MARTAVPVTDLMSPANPLVPSIADPAGSTADQPNGNTITGFRPEVLVLRVANTSGSAANVIVRAGTQPLAESSGQGDLTVSVPATTGVVWLGPLESARFLQPDGSLSVDYAAGFAGKITAFRTNRR